MYIHIIFKIKIVVITLFLDTIQLNIILFLNVNIS